MSKLLFLINLWVVSYLAFNKEFISCWFGHLMIHELNLNLVALSTKLKHDKYSKNEKLL